MARKKATASPATPSAVDQGSSAEKPPAARNGGRPRAQRKPTAVGERKPRAGRKKADAVGTVSAAVDVGTIAQDFEEEKKALEALHRHAHSAALQLAALRHQAEALSREMDEVRSRLAATRQETQEAAAQCAALREQSLAVAGELGEARREYLVESEQLAEVRGQTQALRAGLQQTEAELTALSRQIAEVGARLTEQAMTPFLQIERDYAEARGRLEELHREADEASRTAAALRTRSLEAATEIAQAAAEVRQTLEEAAEDAAEYASVSALLGAAEDKTDEGTAAPEPMQLGVTVAVDSGKVLEVAPDSPAARAGVAPGDVITSADGEPVRNGDDLRTIVSRLSTGREVVLHLERSGKSEEVRANLSQAAAPQA